MKLNRTQKNFRKQMAALKDEGYKFEDDLYSTTRKKRKAKVLGISSILLFLLLLYPLYGMVKSSLDFITINKHGQVVTYVSKTSEIDYNIMQDLSFLIESKSYTSIELLMLYEQKISISIQESNKIRSPKELMNYSTLLNEKYENILSLIFLLKMSNKANFFDATQINAALEEIYLLNTKASFNLTSVFDEIGIIYTIGDHHQIISYEYQTFFKR
ncbi:hypothetical protein BKP45_13440 [Anaerobacillus alkalidiazotrophicus]|uniref:Uncharacterized protein n=1 Tax=Anaerobacillus alkalidiazotrophicus TaxID=472963 RepID=A0A1S2M3U8_9BACI|nr:hypothetical protein [Anaerobacillus alkalidiazotrophicus]OIJ19442.1 hypothetical protein BKP45_13440 [Anaerobacillus alkalidiazotrophicus]